MDHAPIDLVAIQFPGNQFTGEVAPALAELVDKGLIRVIDLIFVIKEEDGTHAGVELSEFSEEVRTKVEPWVDEVTGMISDEDVEDLAASLDPGSSALILIFEHVWAGPFSRAVRGAGGELSSWYHIPREVIDEAMSLRAEA